jgi:hypothetical protein
MGETLAFGGLERNLSAGKDPVFVDRAGEWDTFRLCLRVVREERYRSRLVALLPSAPTARRTAVAVRTASA